MSIRVAVDARPQSLPSRYCAAEPGFEVIGEAGDGDETLRLVGELEPGLVILDLAMPRLLGIDALRRLADVRPHVPTLVLTSALDRDVLLRALQLGAKGVALKESAATVLIEGIRTVLAGEYWIERSAVAKLVQALVDLHGRDPAAQAHRKFDLTKREQEVLRLVVAGETNRDVARYLRLSEDAVKHHLTNIFDKTGASNRVELAVFAIHHRLVGAG